VAYLEVIGDRLAERLAPDCIERGDREPRLHVLKVALAGAMAEIDRETMTLPDDEAREFLRRHVCCRVRELTEGADDE
jgi:hypothetical protein